MKSSIKLSSELRRLLIHCEENCSADCCKDSAFEINERTLRTWFDSERIDRSHQILDELSDLIKFLQGRTEDIFIDARDLESTWKPKSLLTLFSKFLNKLEKTVSTQE